MPRPERAAAAALALALAAGLAWAAGGADPLLPLLAPTLGELDAGAAAADERLGRAEALITALARVHNALGEGMAAGRDPCADPALADLWSRARALGPGVRDAAQAGRAAADRVERMRAAPTVAPLLDPARRADLDALAGRAAAAAAAAVELGAWQARALPPPAACALPALAPAHGLRPPAGRVDSDRVGVLVSEAGLLCGPGLELAVGAGPAAPPASTLCWSAAGCACAPRLQRPGAVLGPGPLPPDEPVVPTPPPLPPDPAVLIDDGVDLEAGPLPPADSAPPAPGPDGEPAAPAPPSGQTPP